MKKLKKSFLNSRIQEMKNVPRSWRVKPERSPRSLQLDARLCQLINIGKQLSCLLVYERSSSNASSATSKGAQQEDASNLNPDNLLSVDFSHNELTSMNYADLSVFEELRSLTASFNQITSFPGMASCVNLTYLCLSYNSIKKLPASTLFELKKLTYLDVRSNLISDISDLLLIPNLRHFNLSYNLLTNLDGLQSLPALEELEVQHNHIENIVGLSTCFTVKRLNLACNNLLSFEHTCDVLRHLSMLQQLDIGEQFNEKIEKFVGDSTDVKVFNGKVIVRAEVHGFSISGEEDLKSELKSQARRSMEMAQAQLENQRSEQLYFFHAKIKCFISEMSDKRQKLLEDFIAWCSYVDGLSPEEARVLARNQLVDFDTNHNEILSEGSSRQATKAPRETVRILAEAARVLSADQQ